MIRSIRNEQTHLRDYLVTQDPPPGPRPRLWPFVLALLTFLAGILIGHKAYAGEAVSLKVLPWRANGPTDVRATVRIEPDARNALLRVVIDSGAYRQSTDEELAGADAPITRDVWFKRVPPGRYDVAGIVARRDRSTVRANTEVCYFGMSEDCQ